jgi:hypothetical protein
MLCSWIAKNPKGKFLNKPLKTNACSDFQAVESKRDRSNIGVLKQTAKRTKRKKGAPEGTL